MILENFSQPKSHTQRRRDEKNSQRFSMRHLCVFAALHDFFFLAIAVVMSACVQEQPAKLRLTNLAHLNSLYEEIKIDGQSMAIVHIYSEYPDYKWVDAGNEGIACVDDAARAAAVYLRHFEVTGDTASLRHGRRLIDFCRYMQAEDGLFY